MGLKNFGSKKIGPKKSGSKIIVWAEILAISYSDDSWNLTPWASNKEMVLYPEKVLCPEYSYSWIPKNFWARFFGTKKIFCCTKLWVPNKFWFQKLIGPENILVPKNIWSWKVSLHSSIRTKLCDFLPFVPVVLRVHMFYVLIFLKVKHSVFSMVIHKTFFHDRILPTKLEQLYSRGVENWVM